MKTLTQLVSLATTLSQNTSTANQSLMAILINDQHRYLIQKYFDNERAFTTTTVGGQSLTLTGSLLAGAVSGTLTAAWTYPTVTQLVNFSDGEQRNVLFTNGSTAITWASPVTGTATTAIATVGVQAYQIPASISKITDVTINVGQLKYVPVPIQTRQDWDRVNFLPYTSDIPAYFFIYNNQINIFPIPSTTGNIITFNYKTRVADLSYADYTTGTVAGAAGSTTITGTTTIWTSEFTAGQDLTYASLYLKVTPPKGDGIWYQIASFTDDTHLTLVDPIQSPTSFTGASYTIGQTPLLSEDFHDMLPYGAMMTYFSTIVDNANKYKEFLNLYTTRLTLLQDYASSKSIDVDLGNMPAQVNPNLFLYSPESQ